MKKNLLSSLTIATILSLTLAAQASFAESGHGHDSNSIGKPGIATKATRTIHVDMTDNMRFTPESITVKQGETIRFVIKNSGVIKHEFVLGTEAELKEHYAMMMKHPEMEHSDPNMITLSGGQSGEVIWQFPKAGNVDFACLQPGHFDAGMKGKVVVGSGGTRDKAVQ